MINSFLIRSISHSCEDTGLLDLLEAEDDLLEEAEIIGVDAAAAVYIRGKMLR